MGLAWWTPFGCSVLGLLRDVAGLTHAAITRQTGCTPSTATKRYDQHRHLMSTDVDYRRRCGTLGAECLRTH